MGKPIVQSREEIDCSIERSLFFLKAADEELKEEVVEESLNTKKIITKEPVSCKRNLSVYS